MCHVSCVMCHVSCVIRNWQKLTTLNCYVMWSHCSLFSFSFCARSLFDAQCWWSCQYWPSPPTSQCSQRSHRLCTANTKAMHFPNWNSFAKIGPTIPQPFGQSGRLSIKSSPRVRKQPPSPLRLFTYDTCRSINGNALGFDCLIFICPLFSLKWKKKFTFWHLGRVYVF